MNRVEMNAADALLDRRLKVQLPAPGILRLFGKRQFAFWMKRPTYGSLLLMARLTSEMDIDLKKLSEKGEEILFPMIAEQGVRASRIIAHGMLRGKWANRLLARPLASYLRWHMTARTLAELSKLVLLLSGAEDFVSITTSAVTMKVTQPMTGHAEKGS